MSIFHMLQITWLALVIFGIVCITCGAEIYECFARILDLADPMDRHLRRIAEEARRAS